MSSPPMTPSRLMPWWCQSSAPLGRTMRGSGMYSRSLSATDRAMMSDWPTSMPLTPARMLMPLVEKVDRSDM